MNQQRKSIHELCEGRDSFGRCGEMVRLWIDHPRPPRVLCRKCSPRSTQRRHWGPREALTLRLPADLMVWLRAEARHHDSLSGYITDLLEAKRTHEKQGLSTDAPGRAA